MNILWPFIVLGVFSGAIYGLAAMGVVLTFKTSGVFNFAYGAVAMFCAYTYWQIHDAWQLSAWAALPILLLLVGPALGIVLERLFRPLAGATAEIQIVVALGVLAVLEAGVPLLYGGQDRALESIFPRSTFGLGSQLRVGYDQLGTLLVSLALGAGLWLLLRHSRFGIATRAVVDNRDLAAMRGVSTGTVGRAAWMISSSFAALVGVLLSPSQGLDVYVLVVVVIYAFAPAVLGRLVSLPLAYAGGMVLGIAQSVLSRWGSTGAVADLEASIPYLALFAVLLALGRRLTGNRTGSAAGLRPLSSLAARSARLRRSVSGRVRIARDGAGGIAALAALATLPLWASGPRVGDASIGVVYAMIALSLVVLTGWTGQISLAQFSFVGVGAFTAGHLAGAHGQHFVEAAAVGVLIAVPLGLLVGLPSLRLTGLYLALATMAFALLMDNLVFVRTSISGGYSGMSIARPDIAGTSFASPSALYELMLGVFAVIAAAAWALKSSPAGRRLRMVRDAPLAAETLGVNLRTTKLTAFALCGALAAFAGAFFGVVRQTVSPTDFAFSASLQLMLLVVLSGRSLVTGAALAGGIYTAQLLPIPVEVGKYIPLAIALGVVAVASDPEGLLSVAGRWLGQLADVFSRLPRSARQRSVAGTAATEPAHHAAAPVSPREVRLDPGSGPVHIPALAGGGRSMP